MLTALYIILGQALFTFGEYRWIGREAWCKQAWYRKYSGLSFAWCVAIIVSQDFESELRETLPVLAETYPAIKAVLVFCSVVLGAIGTLKIIAVQKGIHNKVDAELAAKKKLSK